MAIGNYYQSLGVLENDGWCHLVVKNKGTYWETIGNNNNLDIIYHKDMKHYKQICFCEAHETIEDYIYDCLVNNKGFGWIPPDDPSLVTMVENIKKHILECKKGE